MIWLLLACAAPDPGQTMRDALDPDVSLNRALRGCARLTVDNDRGDCLSAAMESRSVLDPMACEAIDVPHWRDECVFLAAERLRADGQIEPAIAACQDTRFGRECTFHLIRDEAEQRAALPAVDAQQGLVLFSDNERAPDAARIFWQEWFEARTELELASNPADCVGLDTREGCEEGLRRAWRQRVRGVPTKKRCERVASGAPVLQSEDGRATLTPPPELARDVPGCSP